MDAEIYLVRHGETEWNTQGRFQGGLDSPLTRNGREQARQFGLLLARVLDGSRNFAMHVSPLGRTCETANHPEIHSRCRYPGAPHPGSHDRVLGRSYAYGYRRGLARLAIRLRPLQLVFSRTRLRSL
jgi:broad specificity phosphatase PhoE